MTYQEFANKYGQFAINSGNKFGILPEIILSVAARESGFGTSYSCKTDNNFFGIKASATYNKTYWNGSSKRAANDDGGYYRQYQSVQNSFYDFGWLLSNVSRYSTVKANFKNPSGFATAFVNSGYFTGDKTAYKNDLLIKIPKFKALLPNVPTSNNWANYSGLIFTAIIILITILWIRKK